MRRAQSHIIRRQNVRVTATVHDAFALKQKIELLMEEMNPKLSALFDGLVSEGKWLQIGRLDVQVTSLTEDELDEKLPEMILKGIYEQIEFSRQNADLIEPEAQRDSLVISVEQRNIEAFIYFLQNGILPWWFETGSHSSFEDQVSEALKKTNGNRTKMQSVLRSALASSAARQRLAGQFSQILFLDVLRMLAAELGSTAYAEIKDVFEAVVKALQRAAERSKTLPASLIHDQQLKLIDRLLSAKTRGELLSGWIADVYTVLRDLSPGNSQKAIFNDSVLMRYLAIGATRSSDDPKFQKPESKQVAENIWSESSDIPVKIKGNLIKELSNPEGAIISNAGLIIVAPFLPELFNECGLLINNTILDRSKAIAMLHYVVFGDCNYREYDVLLNKLLCCIDVDEPIDLLSELSEYEKQEVNTMLSTAIAYWSVLKGTSVDGLREGFLQRRGSLHHKYDEWFLQVEQSSIDVLLQQLPWTIGFVKLPWMERMIRTQWSGL